MQTTSTSYLTPLPAFFFLCVQDLQHTSLGLLWVGGGLLSLLIESKYNPLAQFSIRKNPLPALLIILTGFAMGQHSQYYAFATTVHTFFGYCLMLGGACRLIQLGLRPSVAPEDEDETEETGYKSKSRSGSTGIASGETPTSAFFGLLSALGIISAGLLFESAHEEQLNIMMYYLTDASTYINWIMSFAFFSVTYMLLILQVGKKHAGASGTKSQKAYNRLQTRDTSEEDRTLTSQDIEMSGFLDAEE